MRQTFAKCLLEEMRVNNKIFFLTGDLGFGLFDDIFKEFPKRAINVGAAEQAMLDIAVGMAYDGKIPFCYSMPTFLLYRPFETLRTYINHENLNVKLVGSGRDLDYTHEGFSHHFTDVKGFLDQLPNIQQFWPMHKNAVEKMFKKMLTNNKPSFISLKRS
jgi:transketolase